MSDATVEMTPAEMAAKLQELQLAFAESALVIANETIVKLNALNSSLDLGTFDSAAKKAVFSMIGNINSSTSFILPDIIKSLTPPAPIPVVQQP